MDYEIEGKIHDSIGNPQSGILIVARDHSIFESTLGQDTSDKNGFFRITFHKLSLFKPNAYLVIADSKKQFINVNDNQTGDYTKVIHDFTGDVVWKSNVIDDVDKYHNIDVKVTLKLRDVPDKYESVVIGSGFGGTILSLTLANKYQTDGAIDKRVCLLERGQWWVSYEMPDSPEGRPPGSSPTIREYLNKYNIPYSTWAYPDNLKGVFRLLASSRTINKKGVYDYRPLGNVHVIAASGVGGGSLVYSNVTERPAGTVFEQWPTQNDSYNKPLTDDFFESAEKFIGVNKITTTAGLGGFKLARSNVFQEAATAIHLSEDNILNEQRKDAHGNPIADSNGKPILDFDAKLSITDIPQDLFKNGGLLEPAPNGPLSPLKIGGISQQELQNIQGILVKYSKETNVCQRQGRCVLGCIPGARHTLNKQLYGAISANKPIDILPLCEVKSIEETTGSTSDYKYIIEFIDYRDKSDGIVRTIKTKSVIIAAGTLGSTELLLRCKKLGKLKISDKVGNHFSTNADILGVINPTEEFVDVTRGPIVTSIAKFKDGNGGNNNFAYSLEDSGFPKMFADIFAFIFNQMAVSKDKDSFIPNTNLLNYFQMLFVERVLNNNNVMRILTNLLESQPLTLSTTGLESVIASLKGVISDPSRPLAAPEERVSHMLWLSGIGIDDANGSLKLDDNTDSLMLKESYKFTHRVYNDIITTMQQFAEHTGKDGKSSLIVPLWGKDDESKTQFVLHPLGGCPMGKNANEGVVDSMGKIFKGNTNEVYDGLYVVDGSIIPTAIGVNPSLTISSLAFRIAENITGDRKYWPQ
jgi:choline dehydrogenase-like flavoprotein